MQIALQCESEHGECGQVAAAVNISLLIHLFKKKLFEKSCIALNCHS